MKIDELLEDDPAHRLDSFLQGAPMDELYSAKDLTDMLNLSFSLLDRVPSENKVFHKDQYHFGSVNAVKEFKRRIQNG